MLNYHLVLNKVVRVNFHQKLISYPSLLILFTIYVSETLNSGFVLYNISFFLSWAASVSQTKVSVCGFASAFSQEGSGLVGSEEAAASAQILPQVMRRSRHVGVTAEASGREPAPRGVRRPPAPKPEGSSSRSGRQTDDEMWAWEKPAQFGNVKIKNNWDVGFLYKLY